MKRNSFLLAGLIAFIVVFSSGCKILKTPRKESSLQVPENYNSTADSANAGLIPWKQFFADTNLVALIDTALKNNRELNIMLQEIEVAKNEIKAKKGEYLPFASVAAGAGVDRSGKYTFNGMSEEDIKADPEKFPSYIGDFNLRMVASWELDIWKKLRNGKKAAIERYLASAEGRNFMITGLVAEIANSYYELLALDNQLSVIQQNIDLQQNALRLIKEQKEAARVSQLAVNRFEAQLLNTTNLQYSIKQQIVETENRINFLTGRFPAPVKRENKNYSGTLPDLVQTGIPGQLLQNRPDIRQAEHELRAANLDIDIARASFYPSVSLSANLGLQAFNPSVWFKGPSALYGLFGDLVAPLVNQNALRANYKTSHAKQVQSIYFYEQTILKAFSEVQNQIAALDNYTKSLDVKGREVDILTRSISVSDNLFKNARADYIEVLLTQREALDSKMEWTEISLNQLRAKINLYKALGGGWN